MKQIILIGARADGQAGVVLDIVRQFKMFEVVGFLDDNSSLHGTKVLGLPVFGSVADAIKVAHEQRIDGFHLCIGDNVFREKCYTALVENGLQVVSVIHPSAVISQSSRLGDGVFIGANVVLTHNVSIGNNVIINTASTVDHDNVLEDHTFLGPGCHLAGRVKIRQGAFLGTGASVIPDVVIGEYSIVGAGAVVIREVAARTKVVGVPAKGI
ncbi:acetyltransferase [Candidatus Woesearchaeota archaeon]|nr:acetyltransferase [Candidatus Woesearchaeota archaeon]